MSDVKKKDQNRYSKEQLEVWRAFGPQGYKLLDEDRISYDGIETHRLSADIYEDKIERHLSKRQSRLKTYGAISSPTRRSLIGAPLVGSARRSTPQIRHLQGDITYDREDMLRIADKISTILDKKSDVELFWEEAEESTRDNIQSCLGGVYKEDKYSNNVFMKIRETITDFGWFSQLHKIDNSDYFDFLTPVRLLNEAVYCMDDSIERTNNVSNGVLGKRALMFYNTLKYIENYTNFKNQNQKKALLNLIPNIMWTVEANAARETTGFQPESRELEHISGYFKEFFEPSNKEYLDIGFYGTLYEQWFREKVRDKKKFRSVWNTRCRATDVIDGLIDIEEDIEEKVFSPLLLCIYNTTEDHNETDIIRETISSGTNNRNFQEIVENHSNDMLNKLKNYNNNIFPTNNKVKKLKERTNEIIDLGILLSKNLENVNENITKYEQYYLDTPILN